MNNQTTTLNLQYHHIKNREAASVAKSLKNTNITVLDLGYNYIDGKGAMYLAKVLKFTQITTLNLERNNIRNSGTMFIAKILKGTKITSLNLQSNSIGRKGAEAIAEVLSGTRIVFLNLARNNIGYEGARAIASVLSDTQITNLNLGCNGVGKQGAVAIARILKYTKIISLNLECNKIRDKGALAIADVLSDTKIKFLNLELNRIRRHAEEACMIILKNNQLGHFIGDYFSILDSGHIFSTLRNAQRVHCHSDTDLVKLLSFVAVASNLKCPFIQGDRSLPIERVYQDDSIHCLGRDLDLVRNDMPVSGHMRFERKFLRNRTKMAVENALKDIKFLFLRFQDHQEENRVSSDIVNALKEAKLTCLTLIHDKNQYQAITSLFIQGSQYSLPYIGDSGAIAIANILKNTQITSLHLEWTDIYEEGGMAIGNALSGTQITSLSLAFNRIGFWGAEAIAKALPNTRINHLNLECNGIGNEGVIAIANVLKDANVTSVNLRDNLYGDIGIKTIIAAVRKTKILTNVHVNPFWNPKTTEISYIISDMMERNRLKIREIFKQLKNSVSSENSVMEFINSDETAGPLKCIELTKIISQQKCGYLNHFISMWDAPSINDRLEIFIENIELKLVEFLRKIRYHTDHVNILLSCEE